MIRDELITLVENQNCQFGKSDVIEDMLNYYNSTSLNEVTDDMIYSYYIWVTYIKKLQDDFCKRRCIS